MDTPRRAGDTAAGMAYQVPLPTHCWLLRRRRGNQLRLRRVPGVSLHVRGQLPLPGVPLPAHPRPGVHPPPRGRCAAGGAGARGHPPNAVGRRMHRGPHHLLPLHPRSGSGSELHAARWLRLALRAWRSLRYSPAHYSTHPLTTVLTRSLRYSPAHYGTHPLTT
eukprot:2794248-Pyramimonas_sp.AAC.1